MRPIILLLALAACDAGVKPQHGIWRVTLFTPDTDARLLPLHGAVVHAWGMEGDSLVILDQDAKTVRRIENLYDAPKVDRTRRLDSNAIDSVMNLALDAWHEDPNGDMPEATDIRDDLIVLDGDMAFYVVGNPIGDAESGKGRPAAGKTVDALYRISE